MSPFPSTNYRLTEAALKEFQKLYTQTESDILEQITFKFAVPIPDFGPGLRQKAPAEEVVEYVRNLTAAIQKSSKVAHDCKQQVDAIMNWVDFNAECPQIFETCGGVSIKVLLARLQTEYNRALGREPESAKAQKGDDESEISSVSYRIVELGQVEDYWSESEEALVRACTAGGVLRLRVPSSKACVKHENSGTCSAPRASNSCACSKGWSFQATFTLSSVRRSKRPSSGWRRTPPSGPVSVAITMSSKSCQSSWKGFATSNPISTEVAPLV